MQIQSVNTATVGAIKSKITVDCLLQCFDSYDRKVAREECMFFVFVCLYFHGERDRSFSYSHSTVALKIMASL